MAYEIPIDSKGFDGVAASLDRLIGKVDELDLKSKGLNGTFGQMRTLGGRVVAAPANPADGPSGSSSAVTTRSMGVLGPRDSVQPWVGNGPRQALMREEEALRRATNVGDPDLLRDQQDRVQRARARVARSDRDLFVGPPELRTSPAYRPPFAGENDFIGPLAAPASAKAIDVRSGPSTSLDPYSYEGPRSRLARYRSMHARAEATGDDDLAKDWSDRVRRQETAVKRLDGDQDQARLDLLMTSRILPGGKLSPLVGRLLAAGGSLSTADGSAHAADTLKSLGIGGGADLAPAIAAAATKALPLLVGGGVAAAAGAAVFGVAQMGHQALEKSNRAFYEMGGSGENVAAAMALGGENASQKALQLGDRLREGTPGAAYLRSQGVRYNGRFTDYSGNYVKALDALRGVDDVQQRIRYARDTGLTDDLWTSDLPQSSFERLKRARAAAGTPEARREDAQYKADLEEAGGWWDSTKQFVGHHAIAALQDAKALLWDLPAGLDGSKEGEQQTRDALDTLNRHWNPWYKPSDEEVRKRKGIVPATNVIPDSDRPFSKGPETINGSLSGAMPAGLRGQAMDSFMTDQAFMLGAWSV